MTPSVFSGPLVLNGLPLLMGDVGLGSHTRRLFLGLARQAPSLSVVALLPASIELNGPLPSSWKIQSIPTPNLGHSLFNALAANQFIGLAARKYPQATFHSPAPLASWFKPAKRLVTWHDCITQHFPRYLGSKVLRQWSHQLSENFLRSCSNLLTVSQASKRDLVTFYGFTPEQIHVLPNWLSPEYYQPQAKDTRQEVRKKYHLPSSYWIYVGGYDYRKNLEFLLHAYAEASRRTVCPPLVLVGELPERLHPCLCDVAGAIKAHGLSDSQIIKTGRVPDDDLPVLYAGAALSIYPSRYEGFGLPPLESMACGCPALVADNSSLPEVVSNPEYRFPLDTPARLIDLLIQAAKTPLPLNPSFRKEDHTEEKAISLYLEILQRIELPEGEG